MLNPASVLIKSQAARSFSAIIKKRRGEKNDSYGISGKGGEAEEAGSPLNVKVCFGVLHFEMRSGAITRKLFFVT